MKQVSIYSDGACQGNPGPGGWASILVFGSHCKEISGGDPATTNNRMELCAAIEGLGALKQPCAVAFHTDSQYLRQGITTWMRGWKARNWTTIDKHPVKNQDLWRQLDSIASRHQITWHWVKGHSGHAQNERCDFLARQEISRLRQKFSRAQLKSALAERRRDAKPAAP